MLGPQLFVESCLGVDCCEHNRCDVLFVIGLNKPKFIHRMGTRDNVPVVEGDIMSPS